MASSILRNRDFRLLYTAASISFLGDWFSTVALLGYAVDLTHGTLLPALVFLAQIVPGTIINPWSGAVADRYNRRRVVLICTALQAVAALSFLLIAPGRAWIIVAGQIALTTFSAFVNPAMNAALPLIVGARDYPRAASLSNGTWGVMLVLGAGAGGVFVSAFGRQTGFVANALSFVVAFGLIACVRAPMQSPDRGGEPAPPVRPLATLRTVWRFARDDLTARALMVSRLGVGFTIGSVGLLAPLAGQFHLADTGTGGLLAGRGTGVAVGAALSRVILTRHPRLMFRACAIGPLLFGISYIGAAHVPLFPLAIGCIALGHLGAGTQYNVATVGLIARTPDAKRGRIVAVNDMMLGASEVVSFLAAGFLGSALGPSGAITLLGALVVVWGAVFLVLTRTIDTAVDSTAIGAAEAALGAGTLAAD